MVVPPILTAIAVAFLGGLAAWAFIETARAARSTRVLAEDLRTRLGPLLDKVDVTVDAANVELLRIDGVITTFEDAGVRLGSAAGTLTNIVHAPADIANEMAGRVRRAWKRRHVADERPGEPDHAGVAEDADAPAATVVALDD